MFFGLMNSPATFQAMMNELFKILSLPVLSSSIWMISSLPLVLMEETPSHHRQVLQILKSNQLFPQTWEVWVREGWGWNTLVSVFKLASSLWTPSNYRVSQIGLLLQNSKDVCTFLGFTGFYHRFIRNYSVSLILSMTSLKNLPWQWGELEQDAFDRLKQCSLLPLSLFTTSPPLPPWMRHLKVCLWCHPLSHGPDWSLWPSIAFMSQSFIEAKWNYDIYDWELLAIVKALCEWWHYCTSKVVPINLRSSADHKNLEVFHHTSKLSYHRPLGWVPFLTFLSPSIISLERKLVTPMLYPIVLITSRSRR